MEVRLAVEPDLPYVMSLMRANRESVGGLPQPAVEERLRRGTLLIGWLNDEPCGYLLYDYRDGCLRIPQACIQYDARRRTYGERLVRELLALYPIAAEVALRCAADLEANIFWRDMGFTCLGTSPGGTRRGRTINAWALWLQPRLFSPADVAVLPAAEVRQDCMYDDTDFLSEAPADFSPVAILPKLAWSNRR